MDVEGKRGEDKFKYGSGSRGLQADWDPDQTRAVIVADLRLGSLIGSIFPFILAIILGAPTMTGFVLRPGPAADPLRPALRARFIESRH